MTLAILLASDAEAGVWATALEVAKLFADVPWVLIGAHMVMLLEREAGRPSGRTTGDVDAVVDVRAVVDGTSTPAQRLLGAGFEPTDAHHPQLQRAWDVQQAGCLSPGRQRRDGERQDLEGDKHRRADRVRDRRDRVCSESFSLLSVARGNAGDHHGRVKPPRSVARGRDFH